MDQTGLHCIEMQVDGVFVAFCAVFDVTTCSLHLSPLSFQLWSLLCSPHPMYPKVECWTPGGSDGLGRPRG